MIILRKLHETGYHFSKLNNLLNDICQSLCWMSPKILWGLKSNLYELWWVWWQLTIALNCSTLKELTPCEHPTCIWSRERRQVLWWASNIESERSWPILSGSKNKKRNMIINFYKITNLGSWKESPFKNIYQWMCFLAAKLS